MARRVAAAQVRLHELKAGQADVPLFMDRIESMDEVIQTPEPDRHTFFELLWITKGSGWHYVDFERYPIRANSLFVIAPGQIHFWDVGRRSDGYVLVFTDELFLPARAPLAAWSGGPAWYPAESQAEPIDALVRSLFAEYSARQPDWRTAMRSLLQLVLVQADRLAPPGREATSGAAGGELTRQFKALVELQYNRQHNVAPYARALGVTPGHLTETIQLETGLSAGVHVRRRIVLEAKRRLIHGEETAEAIGRGLGFEEASYFSRFFRRETGSTPASFRRDFRKKYHLPHG